MPRQARLDAPGALHHIMVRGINKSAIFTDDQDKIRFLDRLGQTVIEGQCAVYAWVPVDNHYTCYFGAARQASLRSCDGSLRGMPRTTIWSEYVKHQSCASASRGSGREMNYAL